MDNDEPPGDGEDEATWVASGSFRVDRRKALDKLSRFQLADPGKFPLSLIRSAVALGAGRIELSRTDRGLALRFDGRPLTRVELKDPYRPLFEGGSTAQRHLALGLLGALQAGASAVEVVSGAGAERARMRASSVLREDVGPVLDPGPGQATVVEVLRKPDSILDSALALAARSCSMCRAEVLVEGRCVAPADLQEPSLDVEDEGIRLRLMVPRLLHPSYSPASVVELHVLGVQADKEFSADLRTPVYAWADSDRFRLDASQSGVVEDERLQKCLSLLKHRSPELIPLAAEALGKRLPEAWAALSNLPGLRDAWRAGMEGSLEPGEPPQRPASLLGAFKTWFLREPAVVSAEYARVAWEARVLRWFRHLCGRGLGDHKKDSRSWILNALWSAPLYMTCAGGWLSLADVEKDGKALWCLGDARGKLRASDPAGTIWVQSRLELDLLRSRFDLKEAD